MKLKDSATATYMAKPQALSIDILKEGVIDILNGLANKPPSFEMQKDRDLRKYEGTMSKQPIEEIDKQLKELRDSW
jgi:hypothetical protein